MATIAPQTGREGSAEEADEASDAGFKPWSAEQAQAWRAAKPPVSPLPEGGGRAGGRAPAGGAAWLVAGGQASIVRSVAYGVLAAWLPAVLFARVLARRMRRQANAGSALMALMVGEGIKIALTIALLLAAPRVLAQVSWLALLAGFVVTIKAAWVALWWNSTHRTAAPRDGGKTE